MQKRQYVAPFAIANHLRFNGFLIFKLDLKKVKIKWVKAIWSKANHNAFTDLCEYKNTLFCCFREAKNHISADGKIRILTLSKGGNVEYHSSLQMPNVDLRDPKLSVTPDGKLLLLAYARHAKEDGSTLFSQPTTWFSSNGKSWSAGKSLGEKNWWLWRLSWCNDIALGFAYNRSRQSLNLYAGNPRRAFHKVKDKALSLSTHNLGYPNESDIIFDDNGLAHALVRRDADSCTAQLGTAKPPYKQWNWRDLGEYIGGPALVKLNNEQALIAGRQWKGNGPKTAIWRLDLETAQLSLALLLPSAGDNSYPGLVKRGDDLFVSYYSSHQDRKSKIYLAKIALSDEVE